MKHTTIRTGIRTREIGFTLWLPTRLFFRREFDAETAETRSAGRAAQTAETRPGSQASERSEARSGSQTEKRQEEGQEAREVVPITQRRNFLRMTSGGVAFSAPLEQRVTIRESVRRFMYPTHIIERVINILGIIGVFALIGGCILGSMGKAIPDFVIGLASAAVGALAGIAQGQKQTEGQQSPGVARHEVPEEVMELLKQQRAEIQELSARIRKAEEAA